MFSSRTIREHLIRGLIGVGAVVVVVLISRRLGPIEIVISVALIGVALFAWRGCPMCWASGLVETMIERRAESKKRKMLFKSRR